eukprot:291254-Amphidinium_carterae.3
MLALVYATNHDLREADIKCHLDLFGAACATLLHEGRNGSAPHSRSYNSEHQTSLKSWPTANPGAIQTSARPSASSPRHKIAQSHSFCHGPRGGFANNESIS